MFRLLAIFLFFFLLFGETRSQSYNFKNYSVENGLPFIQIFSIHQDNRGYLWSSGYGGLSRFDGKQFVNYSPKNGLANHFVSVVSSVKDSSLWIGTKSGLNELVEEKTFNTYTTKDGLPSNNVLCLTPDNAGKMYVGTDNGLCYKQGDKFFQINELKNIKINCFLYKPETGLFIGTSTGLYILSDKCEKIKISDEITEINCVAYNKRSGLWIGTGKGLIQYDLTTKKALHYGISNGLIDENITTITCDFKNNVWIGTHSGLMKFNGKEFLYYKINSDINSNNILCSTIDYEENLWVGTHSGMFKYRDEGFVSFGPHDGLNGTMVFPVIRDNQKKLWVGTEQFGLYKFESSVFVPIKLKQKQFGDTVECFLQENELLLIGSNRGVCAMKDQSFTRIKNLPEVICYHLFKDSKGTIWMGSLGAVYSFELDKSLTAQKVQRYELPSKSNDYQVWGINEDDEGNIWFGAYLSGLYKFDGKDFSYTNKILNIETEDVFSIVKDKFGVFYACSLDGVYIINTKYMRSANISETDGLSSNLVYSITLANKENILWVGTNQGANKIDLNEYRTSGRINITTYGLADGFKGVECNVGIWEDTDGSIWFATVNGLVRYDPKQISYNDKEAKLNFTNLKLFYNDRVLSENAELPFDLNNVSFQYIGICLSNPEKVKYIHKLEGFDRYWSPEVSENITRYSNLPPGNYSFKVRCCNNEGLWNQPISINFNILKPYYQTWWFILSVIGFSVSLIILIFRIRLNQLKNEQRKETEKQIEISKNQLKALRAQMNPHFMFNSLNSIQNYIVHNRDDRAIMYLNKFAKLMRMILNNSEKSHVTLREELDSMKLYIELEQMRFQNKFQYKIIVHEEIDQDFEQIPTMLIQPYVENAILHGLNPKSGEGMLILEIRMASGVMICSIIDDGIGRAASEEMKKNSAKDHKSMGMTITKQRLKILNSIDNSNLSVRITDLMDNNGLPAGTKVDIFIPIT